MNSVAACLSSEALRQLSEGDVSPLELQEMERHVNGCERCRGVLGEVQSDAQWTSEIAPVLRTPSDPTVGGGYTGDLPPADLLMRLLGPTDNPHMLGRVGPYEVVGIIGVGGMGVVFKAFDPALNRFVAIKMLQPHLAASGAARKRFEREGRAAAAVIDDHVMPIHSVAEWKGVPYLVMQYSRGNTLQKRVLDEGPLGLAEVLRLAMQTARGLAAAHSQGLVHRDVKPSNILLCGTVERALLTDFGLARAVDDASITRTGLIAGTPQYMSPEQARGGSVDARSDLFGLGSVMYFMCTGRPPFRADSSYAVLRMITDNAARPIREVNPDVPDWLCQLIDRLMSKSAADRFSSAEEVADLLEACLAHVQQPDVSPLPAVLAPPKPTSTGRRFSRVGSWVVAAGFAAAALYFGVMLVLEAGKGTIVIESLVDDVTIQIKQGESVVDKLTLTRDGKSVRVAAGTYVVSVEGNTDGIEVANGTITLKRGGTETVRITQKPAEEQKPDTEKKPEPKQKPVTEQKFAKHWAGMNPFHDIKVIQDMTTEHGETAWRRQISIALEQEIDAFNTKYRNHPLGKSEPPLTQDEVFAAVRWWLMNERSKDPAALLEPISDEFIQFAVSARYVSRAFAVRQMPPKWGLELQTEIAGAGDVKYRCWNIALRRQSELEPRSAILIRQRLITPLDQNNNPVVLETENATPSTSDTRALPLEIARFNAKHFSLDGVPMPPVTEREILAAVHYAATRRDELQCTDQEFAHMLDVANHLSDTKNGPEISVTTDFQPGDGFQYRIWSLRMMFNRSEKASDRPAKFASYPQYGLVFRQHFVGSQPVIYSQVAWGPVGSNGLQLGVRLDPAEKSYTLGQRVTPTFYLRGSRDNPIQCSLPYFLRGYEIDARDVGGNIVSIKTQGGMIIGGWRETVVGGDPESMRALPLVFGGEAKPADPSAATGVSDAMRVNPGRRCTLQFRTSNFGDSKLPPLETGKITFFILPERFAPSDTGAPTNDVTPESKK